MSDKVARDEYNIEDLLSPVDMLKLGTKDDPCFGTFAADANECRICGDSTLCNIYKGQLLHSKRDEVEKKQKFKDVEMEVNTNYLEAKEVKKVINKAAKKGKLSKGKAFRLVQKELDPKGKVEPQHIQKLIISVVKNSGRLSFIKVKNKRYIQWKK